MNADNLWFFGISGTPPCPEMSILTHCQGLCGRTRPENWKNSILPGRTGAINDGAGQEPHMKQVITAFFVSTLAVCAPGPAPAEGPPAFRDFTFKRVKPPGPGAGPRITIQIEPPPEPAAKPEPPGPDLPKASGVFAWYWDKVRPELTEASPGRLDAAIAQLQMGPGVPTPRLAAMQKIADAYGQQILAATIGTKVSPALVLAVIGIESSGRADAVSGKGAAGLMQLMPDTAARFGAEDPADPAQNIKGGVAYLDWLMGEFGGDPILVLAGYNAGEGAVRKHAGVPPYAETRAYVPKVLAAFTVARGLCQSPPMLISDGCAFRLAAGR